MTPLDLTMEAEFDAAGLGGALAVRASGGSLGGGGIRAGFAASFCGWRSVSGDAGIWPLGRPSSGGPGRACRPTDDNLSPLSWPARICRYGQLVSRRRLRGFPYRIMVQVSGRVLRGGAVVPIDLDDQSRARCGQ
jgi:hypothetical protein